MNDIFKTKKGEEIDLSKIIGYNLQKRNYMDNEIMNVVYITVDKSWESRDLDESEVDRFIIAYGKYLEQQKAAEKSKESLKIGSHRR